MNSMRIDIYKEAYIIYASGVKNIYTYMLDTSLFQAALNLQPPWIITNIDFNKESGSRVTLSNVVSPPFRVEYTVNFTLKQPRFRLNG